MVMWVEGDFTGEVDCPEYVPEVVEEFEMDACVVGRGCEQEQKQEEQGASLRA